MPGFIGVCSSVLQDSSRGVSSAAGLTVYSDITRVRQLCDDSQLCAAKSYVDFLENKNHALDGEVEVWIDGEIFNAKELGTSLHELPELFLKHYLDNRLPEFLKRVDGVFVLMICDRKTKTLTLATDRHGLRPFYISHQRTTLMFAPEVKCFAEFNTFTLKLRRDALQCMMSLEHFVGAMTWLEDVTAADPATIYEYSWNENSLRRTRYWKWSMIGKNNLSFDDAADRMGEILDTTVKTHAQGNFRLGVGLSGGLDSRCLLAATHGMKPETYTFGIPTSADVRIAQRVAKVADVRHHYFDLKIDHWLERRFSGVWKTDGMFNMYHMHYSHLMKQIPKFMDVNLSGFLGDVVMGGSYLHKKGRTYLNQRITPEIASQYYGEFASLCNATDSYFDIDKVDPYIIYNRGRRMIGMGAEEANKTVPQRLPFMGNELMEFCYSLPDELRSGSILYHNALLRRYPKFYKNIPNASTGLVIQERQTLLYKIRKVYNFATYAVKYKLGIATSYTDAYNWLKEGETVNLLKEFLDPRNALYSNYTDQNFFTKFVEPHVQGKANFTKQILGALTVEIWLQQLINKKYRG